MQLLWYTDYYTVQGVRLASLAYSLIVNCLIVSTYVMATLAQTFVHEWCKEAAMHSSETYCDVCVMWHVRKCGGGASAHARDLDVIDDLVPTDRRDLNQPAQKLVEVPSLFLPETTAKKSPR